jgi:hypothetical protein
MREYYKKNPEKFKESSKKYYQKNKEKMREYIREYMRRYREKKMDCEKDTVEELSPFG